MFYTQDCPKRFTTSLMDKITCMFLSHTYYIFEICSEHICIRKNTTICKELLVLKTIFAMYDPETDCIEVSLHKQLCIPFNCRECNVSVHIYEHSNISYLTYLAREESILNWLPEMMDYSCNFVYPVNN